MSKTIQNIDVTPTKRFFVDMFTRDIPSEQAILDLVDNCIDGAKRFKQQDLSKYSIEIKLDKKQFSITDNCGGFDQETAKNYAFRFGRPEKHKPGNHSIGQFGVGMKRALFKFGNHFIVRSATNKEEWAIDIDVNKWVKDEAWEFPWSKFQSSSISKKKPGTEIIVKNLRPEVASQFETERFTHLISRLIKSKHRQFISDGLSILVNGEHVQASDIFLLEKGSTLRPGVKNKTFTEKGRAPIKCRIVVAVAESSPRDAGWYVIGNGRIILEADRRPETGWGAIEDGQGKASVPRFHNQFARFRGIVTFDSEDSSRIPWDTTKNDIDKDNPIWQSTLQTMIEMMRPVIDFLNDLDADIDEHGHQHSPMLDIVQKSKNAPIDSFKKNLDFRAPSKKTTSNSPKVVKIQYQKPTKDVEYLKDILGLNSASAVGEKTFDIVLNRKK